MPTKKTAVAKKPAAKKAVASKAPAAEKVSAVEKEAILQRHDTDTGSPEVQIGLLSQEIDNLQAHLWAHKHDFDAKRGLLKRVAKRRGLMKFLKETNLERYQIVAKKFGLKV